MRNGRETKIWKIIQCSPLGVPQSKMTLKEKIKVIGTITKVDTKFAFVKSEEGSIFVPLNAAVPKTETVFDLAEIYNHSDCVRVRAIRQEGVGSGRNCPYRATWMRRVDCGNQSIDSEDENEESSELSARTSYESVQAPPIDRMLNVRIVSVTESYAYGHIPEFGSIFIPGGAFDQYETKRLNNHLQKEDRVLVQIESQREMNDCRWKAITATKFCESTEDFAGYGKITHMSDMACTVHSEDIGIDVHCSILTYIGGTRGRDAQFLPDVVEIGEYVIFKVEERGGQYRATSWYPTRSKKIELNNLLDTYKNNPIVADSSTQTNMSLEQHLIQMVNRNEPEVLAKYTTTYSLIDERLLT